jgi:DNA topoisomerase-3
METAGRLVDDEALAEALRERGLGTPATRAAIIETLVKREYVKREKKALMPTPKGEQLIALAPAELREPGTTGEWERRLREIEAGQEDAASFLGDIAGLARRIVADVSAQERAAPAAATGKEVIGKCPRCGGDIVEGKKGFGCSRWREADGGCKWVLWKEVAHKTLTAAQARELLTKGETAKPVRGFESKAGKSFDARLKLDRETGRVEFVFDLRPAAAGGQATAGTPGTRRPTSNAPARRNQADHRAAR